MPPNYYRSGDPGPGHSSVDIKSPEDQELARQSCRLARDILRQCEKVRSAKYLLESCEVIPIGPIGPLGECPVQSRPVHCISFLAGSSVAWGGQVLICFL